MPYLFRDTDIAARRLRVLADVFAPSTGAFVREVVRSEPELVIDPGCGPGYLTQTLANLLPRSYVVGLDNSEHFLSLARRAVADRVSFQHHDVTAVPFPAGPSDVIFCRFLLTHLRNPGDIIGRWGTQLRPGGLLLLDEVEWIRTDHPLFVRYLEMVAAMLANAGNQLYVGPPVDSTRTDRVLRKRASVVRLLPVPNPQAAAMFYLNMQAWKEQRFVQERYGQRALDQLESGLEELTRASDGECQIVWGLRQVAFERAEWRSK